jgi:glutamate/tyrosine decarboxylase-like PLP-dependent enzyme
MAPRRQQTRPFNSAPGEPPSKGLGLTRRLHDLVREHPDFEVLHEPSPDLYCFRYVPNGLADRQEESGVHTLLDRLNLEIVEAVRRGGLALVAATRVGGRAAIRASICSQATSEEDVDAAFEAVARWGRLLTRAYPVSHVRPTETEA